MAGIVVSGGLMIIGFVLYAAQPSWYEAPIPAVTITWFTGLFRTSVFQALLNPYLHLYAGIFALMLTPILRLLIAGWTFYRERDFRYVLITAIVLTVIGISIVFSVSH
jgi:uncharacterized membrane protein